MKIVESAYRGRVLNFSIYGGSHEPEIGIRVQGLPMGETVDLARLQAFLDRRAPGRNAWSTARKEADVPEFSLGLSGSRIAGETLHVVIRNENTRSGDYATLRDVPRPMHADFTAREKYGEEVNMAGGGPFSARMTAPLCVLGGICLQILEQSGIFIGAHIAEIGGIADQAFDPVGVSRADFARIQEKEFPVLDDAAGERIRARIEAARMDCDSVGGVIECAAIGLPTGLGGPLFDGMEGAIAHLAFGVPAVKGIEFGAGFAASQMTGSSHNDSFAIKNGRVVTETNRHGGILGGITSGMPLTFRVALKPTPSIAKQQKSVSLSRMEEETLQITGRHDPCVVPRAVCIMEAICAIAVLDALLEGRGDYGTE
ncbi:MAG: chorismate synthase [Ruminococcaceae bacterium]|nr:chorismate synthase [Oscillospiraceae bacterium]